MRVPGIVAVTTLGGLALVALFLWVTWVYVFGNAERGVVYIMWGTLTGTGSLGGQ